MKIPIRMKRQPPNSSSAADESRADKNSAETGAEDTAASPREDLASEVQHPGEASRENGDAFGAAITDGGEVISESDAAPLRATAGAAADPGAAPTEAVRKAVAERDQLLDRLARLQAEFDNYRKRSQREQTEFKQYASTEVVRSLLPVIDNFELALKTQAKEGDFRSGIELIRKQLYDVLAKLGLEAIPAKGELFDPHVHEGIEMVETDEAPDNTVLEELQPGYRFKDRMLRPAMVRVARNGGH